MNSNQGPANEQEPSSSFSISTNTPMYITPSVIKKVKQEQTQEETQVESVLDKKITGNQILEEESTYVNNSIEEGASSPEGNEPQEFNMVNVNQAIGKKPTARSFTQRNAWGNFSYADLITRAIMSSPNKRMTLQEIYAWISDNIPYFMDKKNGPTTTGWKNSVRHTLSIRKRFIRLPNMAFGSLNYKSLWTVDPYAEVRRQNSSTHRLHYQVGLPRLEVANWRPQLRVWTARPLDRATQTEFRNTCCSYCGHPLSFNYNTGNQFTQDSLEFHE